METAAREMGKDPAELRRQNFVREFPHQTPVIMNYDSGDFEGNLNQAMEAADWAGLRSAKGRKRPRAASCVASECRAISRLAALHLRRRSVRLGLALAFGKVPRCG